MNEHDEQQPPEFSPQAKARIERIKRMAEELTVELGLPPEVKYAVLQVVAAQAPPDVLATALEESNDVIRSANAQADLASDSLPAPSLSSPAMPLLNGQTAGGQGAPAKNINSHTSRARKPRGKLFQSVSTLAAVIIVALLVGSIALVLRLATQSHLSAPSRFDCHFAASTTASEEAGLYATADDGVYKLNNDSGHLAQKWRYTMSAPWTDEKTNGASHPAGFFGWAIRVETHVNVMDGIAYFGGNEDDSTHNLHHYLYAVNAANGLLCWRYQIDNNNNGINGPAFYHSQSSSGFNLVLGAMINAPQLWQHTVYIDAVSSSNNVSYGYVIALDKDSGAVQWTYKYPYTYAGINGLGAIANGLLYITNANTLFTLNAANGQKQWSIQIAPTNTSGQQSPITQYLQVPQVVNGVVYTAYEVQADGSNAGSSQVYAFNAANGTQLWHSQRINDLVSTFAFTHSAIYFATQSGLVYALRAQNGASFWSYNAHNSIYTAPEAINGTVFVAASPTPGAEFASLLALSADHGNVLWTYKLPSTGFPGGNQFDLVAGGGVIYAGTNQGKVYSINEQNGSLIQIYTVKQFGNVGLTPILTLITVSSQIIALPS